MEELWALGVFLREMQGCVNSWTIDYLRGNPALAPDFKRAESRSFRVRHGEKAQTLVVLTSEPLLFTRRHLQHQGNSHT